MKVGLSYSRCVRDIVDGVVDIADVLVIIARTDFDPHDNDQWSGIWAGYHDAYGMSNPEWFNYPPEDEDRFRSVSIELWETGRLHQPRKFGAYPRRLHYYWLDVIPEMKDIYNNQALKKSWEQFRVIAGLTNAYNVITSDFKDNF
jgi:hypothetical protein